MPNLKNLKWLNACEFGGATCYWNAEDMPKPCLVTTRSCQQDKSTFPTAGDDQPVSVYWILIPILGFLIMGVVIVWIVVKARRLKTKDIWKQELDQDCINLLDLSVRQQQAQPDTTKIVVIKSASYSEFL